MHQWFNWTNNLQWYADDYWTDTRAQSLHDGHNNFPWKEYHFENEAYNPGGSFSCDRLNVIGYSAQSLPVQSWAVANGCGSSSINEEVKVYLDENSIQANTWYRHLIDYGKSGSGAGEVNYSFSNNWSTGDDWLGKISYGSSFNYSSSDPGGLVDHHVP